MMKKSVSEDERAWFIFLLQEEDESEDGDRVSFPRWGKRNVVSHHFTEPTLEITVLEMLAQSHKQWFLLRRIVIIQRLRALQEY